MKDVAAEGLRGVAAINVFLAHFFLCFFPMGYIHFFPWVAQQGAWNGVIEHVLSLPFLSPFWSGRLAVSIFFVLSGYVLTKKYFETGDASVIRSLAIRRYLRLGIPVFASVMFAFALWHLDAYHIDQTVALSNSSWLKGMAISHPDILSAIEDGVYGVILQGHASFNTVFWTMRVEFIGSMLIFSYALISFPDWRQWLSGALFVVLVYLLAPQSWPYYIAFLLGSHIGRIRVAIPKFAHLIVLVAALYFASADGSRIFAPLRLIHLDPLLWGAFWSVIAGALIVFSIHQGGVRFIFETKVARFFGRISYPLYLVHAPIVFSLGCWTYVSLEPSWGRTVSAGASLLITFAASVVTASLFERFVDRPAIAFGKRLLVKRAGRGHEHSGLTA